MTVALDRRRAPLVLASLVCLGLGAVVWLAFFDLYVSRGAREYLQKQAEFELGLGEAPSMADVMRNARRDGAIAATWLGGCVTITGWGVAFWMGRTQGTRRTKHRTPRTAGPQGPQGPKRLQDA